MKQIHLIISGDVIGVGYRSWLLRQAKDLRLTGWVKNREDDAVELVAEGKENNLEELLVRCRRGPDVSWVKDVQVERSEAKGEFVGFEVIY